MRVTRVNQQAIDALVANAQVQADVKRKAEAIASKAADRAPKDTGAGAASIHAEPVLRGGDVVGQRVGWDEEHDYMRFPEYGTEKMPAEPFMRPAVHEVDQQ